MPFFGPSLAGRSNSTTGTLTFTRCAAICAPITPAPSTATFFTWKRFVVIAIPSPAAGVPPGRCSWSLYMGTPLLLPSPSGEGWDGGAGGAVGAAVSERPHPALPQRGRGKPLLHPHPGLGATEGAEGAAHFQLLPTLDGRQAQLVFAAIFRIE